MTTPVERFVAGYRDRLFDQGRLYLKERDHELRTVSIPEDEMPYFVTATEGLAEAFNAWESRVADETRLGVFRSTEAVLRDLRLALAEALDTAEGAKP